MKLRTFKHGLMAAIAAITFSVNAIAQEITLLPPLPPMPPQTDELITSKFNKEIFNKSMAKLQVKLKGLKVKMNELSIKQSLDMKLAMKEFNLNFKDFGKDFSGTFNGMVPDMTESFKGWNNFNYNTLSDSEYKKRIEKGELIEKIKNYSKTYSVDGNDVLHINNSFGKITVNTWNRNEFKVDVQMTLSADEEETANNLFNGTYITGNKAGNTVSFNTTVGNGGSHRQNRQNIVINYTVYMPAGNAIDINNKFGSVVLPELTGKANVRVSYGNLTTSGLMNTQNNIVVKFGDASVTNFNGGKIVTAYGKVKAGTLNNVDADISFAGFTADKLKGSADVRIKYGDGFRIGAVDKSVRNINIDASFSKINLDFKESENFNFDVTTKFGSFKLNDDNMKITSKSPSDEDRGWSSTKSYRGYIGKNNTDGKIVINASYTGVSFN